MVAENDPDIDPENRLETALPSRTQKTDYRPTERIEKYVTKDHYDFVQKTS
jgi:hypothetical protein